MLRCRLAICYAACNDGPFAAVSSTSAGGHVARRWFAVSGGVGDRICVLLVSAGSSPSPRYDNHAAAPDRSDPRWPPLIHGPCSASIGRYAIGFCIIFSSVFAWLMTPRPRATHCGWRRHPQLAGSFSGGPEGGADVRCGAFASLVRSVLATCWLRVGCCLRHLFWFQLFICLARSAPRRAAPRLLFPRHFSSN